MALAQRQEIMRRIEAKRRGRALVCFFNFDRISTPPIPGLSTQFHSECKEALFRVLKESTKGTTGVDLCLYTRGGDVNSVWPIASLLREFDPTFEVLVPFRCHSGGTLLALGARRIIMGPLSELSPIDPSTGNQFNPLDKDQKNRLSISVEDVKAYKEFITGQFAADRADDAAPDDNAHVDPAIFSKFIARLTQRVHPLALGNVHRVHQQIKILAQKLLKLNDVRNRNLEAVVTALTTKFYSHLHMINRHEARDILGSQVAHASPSLSALLDELLRAYELDFGLREPLFLSAKLGDQQRKDVRFVGGACESRSWSYLYHTKGTVEQFTRPPANIQVQLPPGQAMPLIPGLPREYLFNMTAQGWVYNEEPQGVTV